MHKLQEKKTVKPNVEQYILSGQPLSKTIDVRKTHSI